MTANYYLWNCQPIHILSDLGRGSISSLWEAEGYGFLFWFVFLIASNVYKQ